MSSYFTKWLEARVPSGRLVAFSERLSRYAHMEWVVLFFFFVFFLDSFIIFVPADGLISVTLLFAPDRRRPWVLAAVAGALCGFVIFYFLSLSSFRPWVIDLIHQNDMSAMFDAIVAKSSRHGYLNLTLAVSTFVPPVACLVAGIFIGLNPFLVLVIVLAAKAVRIYLMIALMRSIRFSVLKLKERLRHRREPRHPSSAIY